MHLGALAIEHQEDLFEVGLRIRVDLVVGQHRPRLGAAAGVADHGRVVPDDQHHRMAVLLEQPQRIEHDEMADVKIRCGWVEPELHAQLVAAFEARAEMIGDVDLDRAVAQPLEERRRQSRTRLLGRG